LKGSLAKSGVGGKEKGEGDSIEKKKTFLSENCKKGKNN